MDIKQSLWLVEFGNVTYRTAQRLHVVAVDLDGAAKAAREWLADDWSEVAQSDRCEIELRQVTHVATIDWPRLKNAPAQPGEDS